jgi:hypothetical protein
VQDRITGQINEERMSVYVRLGIRLLYKGLKSSNMEKKRSENPWFDVFALCSNIQQFENCFGLSALSRVKNTTTLLQLQKLQASLPSINST